MWNNEYRLTTLCVDSYEDGVLAGRLYNPYLDEGIEFKSLSQFLLLMEQMLDDMAFPQAFTETRTFAKTEIWSPQVTGEPRQGGRKETFSVRILFRQNTSWQGFVVWHGKNREQRFRSTLELIFLIDSALRGTAEE